MTAEQRPQVSVVIPTYNQASLLKIALRSVIDQTFQDWEAIVINNFSSDDTESVVAAFQDPRISLINFANHGVIAASRNLGIQKARGTYVAFLDSDDIWLPSKLENCMNAMKGTSADGVCHNEYQLRNGVRERVLRNGPAENFNYLKMLFHGNCVSTSALVIRRDRLLEARLFNEEKAFNTAEDYDLWLRLARNNCNIIFLQQELGDYLLHQANNSGSVARHFNAVLNVTQSHFASVRQNLTEQSMWQSFCLSWRMRIRIATLFYGAARQAQAQGMKKESLQYFARSLSLNPLRLKTIIGLALLALPKTSGSRHA
jgi:glycosyltransferase involved in cell wall biosynthesis